MSLCQSHQMSILAGLGLRPSQLSTHSTRPCNDILWGRCHSNFPECTNCAAPWQLGNSKFRNTRVVFGRKALDLGLQSAMVKGVYGSRTSEEMVCGSNGVAMLEADEPLDRGKVEFAPNGEWESTSEASDLSEDQRWVVVKKKLARVLSNAQKHSQGFQEINYSLGVDFGDSKTGLSISLKGYAPRPLSVVHMRGDKLIQQLLQIAAKEKADEFIVGLPKSVTGEETLQSNKTRSFAGKLAGQAARRGWRVYLIDEYGSSQDGMDYMLGMGVKKRSRKEKLDAYAALMVLQTYFNGKGAGALLVVPKGLSSQEQLCHGDNLARVQSDEDNYDYMEDD